MSGLIYRVLSRVIGENVFEMTDDGEIHCHDIQTGIPSAQIPTNCKLVVKDSNDDIVFGVDHYGIVYVASDMHTEMTCPFFYQVTPSDGAEAGGDSIEIDGSNFAVDAEVTIDGDSCTNVVVNGTGTQIACDTPAGSAGVVALKVTNPNHGSFQVDLGFTYREVPTTTPPAGVDPVSPATGNEGAKIILSGSGFFSAVGLEPTITINSQSCTGIVFYNSTKLACLIPANANGTYDVIVTFADGQVITYTNGFEYVASPTVVSVAPYFGVIDGGETIIITGTGFAGGATVTVGGKAATSVVIDSATQITCVTPSHRGIEELVDVIVTNADDGQGTLRNGFEYFQQDSTTLTDAAGATSVDFTGPGGKIVVIITSLGQLSMNGQPVIGFDI